MNADMFRKLVLIMLSFQFGMVIAADVDEAIQKARTSVTANFKAPLSAQFRNEVVRQKSRKDGATEEIICGEVNGKNSYGGYIGFKKYFVGLGLTQIEGTLPGFDAVWASMCSGQ